ncbi:MAG: AsmA-like C-terminal region-containing protein [Rhodobacterales bacterium]
MTADPSGGPKQTDTSETAAAEQTAVAESAGVEVTDTASPDAETTGTQTAVTEGKLPKKPRKKRAQRSVARSMLWSGLWTFALMAALLGLLGAALVTTIGRPIAAPDWMRSQIEDRIATALPGVQIGFTDLVVIVEDGWAPRIRLNGVSLRDATGTPVATLGEFEAGLSGSALLRGQIEPGQLRISGLRLALRRASDGSFDLAFGDALPPVERAPNLVGLLNGLDNLLDQPRFAGLRLIDADNLSVTYEDARAGRTWQVDGGRIELRRNGNDLSLRGDLALLSGYDYATSLSLSYSGRIGDPSAQIGFNFEDMTASDLASQSGALAWLGVVRAPISGALRVSVDQTGTLGPLSVALQIGAGVVQPNDQAEPIPFDSARSYMTYLPETGQLQFDDLSVNSQWISARAEGRATLENMTGGWPTSLLGQFRITDITANPADLYENPVELEEALLDFRLKLEPFELSIGQLTLFDRGRRLLLDGRVGVSPAGWDLGVNGSMDAVLPERILELWPERLVPGTRAWIADNLHSARLQDVQLGYRRTPGTTDRLHLAFAFDRANVTYARAMPLLTAAAGQASLTDRRFVISATEGYVTPPQGGKLDMTGTSFIISDVGIRPTPAQIRLATQGSITATLAMLDSPNLRLIEKAGREIDLAEGQAEVTARIDMPLKPALTPDELRFAASARLTDVVSEEIVPGRVLRAAAMEVKADAATLSIGGMGRLGNVPFNAVWTNPLRDNTNGQSQVAGTVTLSQSAADELGLGLPPGTFSGAGQGQLVLDLARGRAPAFRLTSDLAGLGLSVPPLGWSLSQSGRGTLEVAGTLGTPVNVSRIALEAPGLNLAGAIDLSANGQLAAARFSRVRAGGWLDAPVTLTGRGAGRAPGITVNGGRLDLRNNPMGSGGGGGGGPLTVALDRLDVTDTIALTGFRAEFANSSQLDGLFTGRVNDQAPIRGRIAPMNGASAVRIQSDNAGQAIAAAGLLRQARDGVLDLVLTPTGAPGSFDGHLKIADFRVRDAPAMAALINAVSVVGLLEQMNGRGLHFSEVEARFLLTPQQVVLREASAVGASLGVSMDGYYDLTRQQMDFQGVFSPVYLINSVGSLLTRKGEGLFGFTFKLGGTPDTPRVQVNPLSALAPGMLREIFRRPPPTVTQ